jgi:hypothetical protein
VPIAARPRTGFVYAAGDEHPLKGVVAGGRVALPSRKPPWIVVDHVIEKVIVAEWPGKLWAVEIIEADPEAQQGLVPNAWYTRATAVNVVEELPLARLFGHHGEPVCRIIETARQIDLERVQRLAEARSPSADDAYSAAWNTWLSSADPASPHLGGDHSGVLDISGSPINCGFL